jgi:hypothetical protein
MQNVLRKYNVSSHRIDAFRIDTDTALVPGYRLEAHDAIDLAENGVVLADPDVGADMELSATLTDNDGAAANELAIGTLHAEALGLAVAAVTGGTHTLLVSHDGDPFRESCSGRC